MEEKNETLKKNERLERNKLKNVSSIFKCINENKK